MKPVLVDALLRLTRDDDLARPLFEQVRPDLRLWVCELHPPQEEDPDPPLRWVAQFVEEHLPRLSALKEGSQDYTLHLAVACPADAALLRLPPELLSAAAAAGFGVELFFARG